MKLLIIIFLLPLAIFAHRYRLPTDPNDTPFLPIFPVYPYNPKLMKRGVEKDHSYGRINSELYAPRPDAKDSYTTKYNGNYHRDSHSSTPTQSIYQPSYISSNQPYAQSTAYTPGSSIPSQYYNTNPYLYTIYNGYPVALVAQSHSVNPRLPNNNYYYQQQYHPNLLQAYSSGVESSQINHEYDGKFFGKFQDIPKNELNTKDAQFIDGTNYLTNSKELETSASTYRLPSHINQENDISDVHLRSAQLPRTMIRIIPYDGQQFRAANFAVASGYKYPQLNPQQLINQAVENGFGQSAITNVAQGQYDIAQVNSNLPEKNNLQLQSPVIAKTGLAYVMNSGPFNISPRHIAKALDSYQDSSVIPIRNQKPVTTVTVEGSHGLYIPPTKVYKHHQSQLPEYNGYTTQNGQVYNGLQTSSMLVDYKKNEQNYSTEDIQQTQPDQSYSYQYSGYQPASSNQQIQLDNYKITLDDVNYASKRNS